MDIFPQITDGTSAQVYRVGGTCVRCSFKCKVHWNLESYKRWNGDLFLAVFKVRHKKHPEEIIIVRFFLLSSQSWSVTKLPFHNNWISIWKASHDRSCNRHDTHISVVAFNRLILARNICGWIFQSKWKKWAEQQQTNKQTKLYKITSERERDLILDPASSVEWLLRREKKHVHIFPLHWLTGTITSDDLCVASAPRMFHSLWKRWQQQRRPQ